MRVLNFYAVGKVIPDNSVYIGRNSEANGLYASKFANPFPLKTETDRMEVIGQYRQWLAGQVNSGAITREELADLHGKDLICYCAPKMCHGNVLVEAVKWAVRDIQNNPKREGHSRPGP